MEIFISYCRRDLNFVQMLNMAIQREGISCWRDIHCITGGDNVPKEVVRAIKACKIMLAIVSIDSNKSKWVQREIDIALLNEIKILPIVIRGATIPPVLANRHYLSSPPHRSMDEIIKGIAAAIKKETIPGAIEDIAYINKADAVMIFSSEKAILDINSAIDNHPVCMHKFFELQKSRSWPLAWVRVFSPDYFYFISTFPHCLRQLMAKLDGNDLTVIAGILFQETGCGVETKSHSKLFAEVLARIGIPDEELSASPRHEVTNQLTSGMRHLYSGSDKLIALGAQYALERQAFSMIANLDRIFASMQELEDQPRMEYFSIHLKDEPEHMRLMRTCVKRYLVDAASAERIKSGGEELLNLLNNFWTEMHKQVSRMADKPTSPTLTTEKSEGSVENSDWTLAENDILRFLVNIVTPNRNLKIQSNSLHSIQSFSKINDVAGFVEALITICVKKRLPHHLRIYFAFKLNEPSGDTEYRFGISRTGYRDWMLNQDVSRKSNIAYVYKSGIARAIPDTTRASNYDNQYIDDEFSVYNIPVKVDGRSVCVLGLSSPKENDVEIYENTLNELAIYLEIVFDKFIQSRLTTDMDAVRFVRAELAAFFEGGHP
jgi:pyrroloquinoline quinone (PQQ) biosynthesis protein C